MEGRTCRIELKKTAYEPVVMYNVHPKRASTEALRNAFYTNGVNMGYDVQNRFVKCPLEELWYWISESIVRCRKISLAFAVLCYNESKLKKVSG